MAGILIIAHAPLATALRDCIAHIYGGVPARIGCIDVLADSDPAQVMAFAHAELHGCGKKTASSCSPTCTARRPRTSPGSSRSSRTCACWPA
jgi:hypothetical protein